MNKEFSDRIDYLTNLFKSSSEQQNSQFDHMEYQNKILHEEHDKMNEIGSISDARTESLENAIGIWLCFISLFISEDGEVIKNWVGLGLDAACLQILLSFEVLESLVFATVQLRHQLLLPLHQLFLEVYPVLSLSLCWFALFKEFFGESLVLSPVTERRAAVKFYFRFLIVGDKVVGSGGRIVNFTYLESVIEEMTELVFLQIHD